MRLRRALACFVVATAGCNLVVDLDGLSGGPVDTPLPDSGPLGDAQPTEASVVDAGDATVVDAGSFCGQHSGHTWCEDFDSPKSLESIFDSLDNSSSTFAIGSPAASAPNSLRVFFPKGTPAEKRATRGIARGDSLKLFVDLRVEHTFTSGKVVPLVIRLPLVPGEVDHFLYIETYGGPLRLLESYTPASGTAQYAGGDIQTDPKEGTFLHFEVAIDRNSKHVVATLDGKNVVDRDLITGYPAADYAVEFGDFAETLVGGDATFHFDNVVVDSN